MAPTVKVVKRIWRRIFNDVAIVQGDEADLRVLKDVKLYRDVTIGGTRFRGSEDTLGGDVEYLFQLFPDGYFRDKTVLDLGSAGGAICFEASRRGCAMATGIEMLQRRIAGAVKIQNLFRIRNVRFLRGDFYDYLDHDHQRYDVIFALNIFHHVQNPIPLLQKICRACKDVLCIEMPEDVSLGMARAYCPQLERVEAGMSLRSIEDYLAYLKLMSFERVKETRSGGGKQFYLADASPRRAYLLKYARALKDRATRFEEMRVFQASRDRCDEYVRRDPHFIEYGTVTELLEHVTSRLAADARRPAWNFLLVGPRASGKSYVYEQLPGANKPAYQPKIFKFPNAGSRGGLKKHLAPTATHQGTFAHALLSTADDSAAHCSMEDFLLAVTGTQVVCLVCYCDFLEHFNRLYEREVKYVDEPDADVSFDLSLRFDYIKWIEALRNHGVRYFVISPQRRAT